MAINYPQTPLLPKRRVVTVIFVHNLVWFNVHKILSAVCDGGKDNSGVPLYMFDVKVFETLPDTLQRLDEAIHEEQARADCTSHNDPNVGALALFPAAVQLEPFALNY